MRRTHPKNTLQCARPNTQHDRQRISRSDLCVQTGVVIHRSDTNEGSPPVHRRCTVGAPHPLVPWTGQTDGRRGGRTGADGCGQVWTDGRVCGRVRTARTRRTDLPWTDGRTYCRRTDKPVVTHRQTTSHHSNLELCACVSMPSRAHTQLESTTSVQLKIHNLSSGD